MFLELSPKKSELPICTAKIWYNNKKPISTRKLQRDIYFHEKISTFTWEKINILLSPSNLPFSRINYRGEKIPLLVENIDVSCHNISALSNWVRFQVLEHILGVSVGLHSPLDIYIEWSNSWPTEKASISEFCKEILRNSKEENISSSQLYTVKEPVKITFWNKRASYTILHPDEGNHQVIIDLTVSYPGKSIWTQRISYNLEPETFTELISFARSSAFWVRWIWLDISNKIWKYIPSSVKKLFWKFGLPLTLSYEEILRFDKESIYNPLERFEQNGEYLELLFHEVLDKLGAYWIALDENWKIFVGKIEVFATSHEQDIQVMKAIKSGLIKTTN
jgi:UDP-3-O-acyl-N-acetylglucosamine deacetylase